MDKKDKELERLRGMEKLRMADVRSPDYTSPLDQDVMKVRGGAAPAKDAVTKISNMTDKINPDEVIKKIPGMTEKIDTKQIAPILSGDAFADKIMKLRALKAAGKKVMAALPFAGAGMAALSGDPAMAAEELASDAAGPAGMAYEAIKPESAGNPEEERQMLAERDAMENYKQSPARLAKLKALLGK